MRKIYIGLSRPKKNTIFSYSIQKFENTRFSHSYVRFYSESIQRDLIYQASGSKVNFDNIQHFKEINTIITEFEIEITEEQYKKVLQFCVDNVGKPYGIKTLLGILIYRISGVKTLADNKDSFVCSELVGYIMHSLGLISECDLDYFTPKNVYEVLNYLS